MILGLLTFAAFVAVIAYVSAVVVVGDKIQDWAHGHDYPDVLLPWAFTVIALLGLPISIAVAVFA